jgi:hypothetical protein
MRAHAAAAAEMLVASGEAEGRELVKQILADWRAAPISPKDCALYDAVEMYTARRGELTSAVHQSLRDAGWNENEILESIAVCAMFCFYNAWVDLSGHDVLRDEDYAGSGRRLAAGNYLD